MIAMYLSLVRAKYLWLMGGILGCILLWLYTPINLLFDRSALICHLQMAGMWGVVLFLLGHLLATVLGLPGTILVVAGGAVYGVVLGTVWSVIGATLGAIAAFLLSRYWLHTWFVRRLGQHPLCQRLNRWICDNGLNCVLMLRFTPISPFNVVNFVLGLTPVSLRDYSVGTMLGIMPGTLAYSWIGASGVQALQGEGFVGLAIALSLLAVLSILPMVLRFYFQRRSSR